MGNKSLCILTFLLFIFFYGMSLGSFGKNESSEHASIQQDAKKAKPLREGRIIPTFMIIMGVGMVGIWTMDIATGKFKNQGNFFEWRNDGGDYMWTHISAEYFTGLFLITSALGLFLEKNWAVPASLVSLGALAYTSLNSLGWTFVEKNRYGYAVPMGIGGIGSIISITILL